MYNPAKESVSGKGTLRETGRAEANWPAEPKPLCHRCARGPGPVPLIKCQKKGCELFYCRRCLTCACKYSKKAASALPTPDWECPRCRRRCTCKK